MSFFVEFQWILLGFNLVGGAITILKNMSSSMGRILPYIMEHTIHV